MAVRVLGIDPGLAHMGLAEADLYPDGRLEPVALHVVTTKKSDKKTKVLSGDDDFRRTLELARVLIPLFQNARIITTEGASWPRNNRSCALIGRGWGVVATLVEMHKLPVVSASPQAIKKRLCGQVKVGKEEVQKALDAMFEYKLQPLLAGHAHGLFEHPYDALGSIVACLDSDVLKMARTLAA